MTHKNRTKNTSRVYFANGRYIDLPRKQARDLDRIKKGVKK